MKKLVMAFAALLVAGVAHGQAVTVDGQRTIPQSIQIGGVVRADTTQKSATMSSTGGLAVYDESASRSVLRFEQIFEDTLSLNGQARDSSDAIFDVSDLASVSLFMKIEGLHGAPGQILRVGVTPIWQNTANLADTTTSYAMSAGDPAAGDSLAIEMSGLRFDAASQHSYTSNEHVVGFAPLVTATAAPPQPAYRTAIVNLKNPGMRYLKVAFRVLSYPNTATQGGKFRLRVHAGGKAD